MAQAIKEPILQAVVTAGAETADVRRFTIQVTNRQKYPRNGRYLVQVWSWDGLYTGTPGAQLFTLITGSVGYEFAPDNLVQYITDEHGKIELDITIVGAATRYVHAVVLGEIHPSAAAAWV
jgi:hypothetical protein